MSISNGEAEEKTVEGLKSRVKVCTEDNNDLKTKVMRIEGDLLARYVTAKAMALQVSQWRTRRKKQWLRTRAFLLQTRK